MSAEPGSFADCFLCLTGHAPMRWQRRLFDRFMDGNIPSALDLPTGLGKTSVMAIWLVARALADREALRAIPRRLVYIVDRRAVVDQATDEAGKLRDALDCNDRPDSGAEHLKDLQAEEKERRFAVLRALKKSLELCEQATLAISTLRGAHIDNREWLDDPAAPAIIVGTVDMIGSRLLFEGYGVSRRMRPYHAGLLGADTLIVLDEAHLVPPFADLLRAVESDAALWPKERERPLLPRFAVLPLSATQRVRHGVESEGGEIGLFGLEDEDRRDALAARRLNARKRVRVEPLAGKDHDWQLAEAAFELATGERPARVVVFCNRREKGDEDTGPSAQGVAEAITMLAAGDRKAGREKIDIAPPVLLVGARRAYEREQTADALQELGFTGVDVAERPERPTFLVATSAGEVGVDLDADHMVCDLAPWERLVQRLGRVNRRGGEGREAQVVVFDTSDIEKDEARKACLVAARGLLKRIETDLGGKAGPASLQDLRRRVGEEAIEAASTPEPLHPALTRALVDAWSMTSLEHHTGRPEVAPWLRGWIDEKPQTSVIWRRFLPLRNGEGDKIVFSSGAEVNAFFEAAPPHESEKLQTEAYRVAAWLRDRTSILLQRKSPKETAEAARSEDSSADETDGSATPPSRRTVLQSDDVVALILSPTTRYQEHLTLGDLARDRKGRAKDEFHARLAEGILILDARFGGLTTDGLLDSKRDVDFPTADISDDWSRKAGFRVRQATSDTEDGDWYFEDDFVLRDDGDGDPEEWLIVEHYRSAAQSEDARSISRPQELHEHQDWAEQKALSIAQKVGLSGVAAEALTVAAFLHDEGKRASRWQRAFKAPRQKNDKGAFKVFAKTRGPIDQGILDGYRHEFGSLPRAEAHDRFKALPEDWRDLVLHLIAAHHGQARPVIGTNGCEDAPPSALEERARDVALRFARLQKRWGPWGLAWWEALLRAADQQASRKLSAEKQ